MCRKILIPYSTGNYNQIMKDFQILKINSMEKDELLVNLKNSESWLYDCYFREECITLFTRTGGFSVIGLSFDDLFKIGVDTTILQLNKRCFFDIQNYTNLLILKKIKSRIVNNIRNYFNPTRKVNYLQFQNLVNQIENSYEGFEDIIFEIDIQKIDKETLRNSLREVWENAIGDMDFDILDFQDLCGKYGFKPIDILLYDPWVVPMMSIEACNNSDYQLVLVFDDGEIV